MEDVKLIIDNDAGGDDAMAIFIALLYEKHFNGPRLIGLTTGNGNTNENNVYINNQKILRIADRQDVPIYRGSTSSIVVTPASNEYFGTDGLGNNDLTFTDLVPANKQPAVMALIEQSKIHKDKLIVVAIGTLTNVALAIKLDPDFINRIGHLYIGAGHIQEEKPGIAEFNARTDAEAYHIVVKSPSPDRVTVLPFSQVMKTANYTKEWRMEVLGAIDTDIMRAQNKFEKVSIEKSPSWDKLDPALIALVVRPELVEEYKYSDNDIILNGTSRGIITNTFGDKQDSNVRIIYSIKHEEYKQFLLDVFSADIDKETDKGTKFVIDNDAGGDDAMAIFMALIYEKYYNNAPKVVGLTTVNGNTNEENVYTNNQKLLKIANRQDVPIFRGSKTSIVTTPEGGVYFGEDGLGDTGDVYTDLVPAKNQHAVAALIELSKKYDEQLVVLTLGTLTNVALAMKLDPNFLGRLAHLYIGAGHVHDDSNPNPEFNAQMDVEAYHIIAQKANPDKVTVVPFSQIKSSLNISKTWREEVLGAKDTTIMKALNKFDKIAFAKVDRWQDLDPAVVAIALRPDLVDEYKYSKNDIIMCGEKRGINTNVFVEKEDANVRMVYSVKKEQYKEFLLDVFSKDLGS